MDVRLIKGTYKLPAMDLDDLEVAISAHRFGDIVDPKLYEPIEPIEPSLYLASMSSEGDEITRTFAGALLQTESSGNLLLEVEVYVQRPS